MIFSWCMEDRHDKCRRQYTVFYIDNKNKVVYTDEVRNCECRKRGCECYVKPSERAKPVKKTRRKK